MWRHGLASMRHALAKDKGTSQPRETGTDVNHSSACKIQRTQISQPPSDRPDPVSQGIVDEGGPKKNERQKGTELHPLHEGPGDQRRRDHGKHKLKHHKGLMWNCCAIVSIGVQPDPTEPQPLEASDQVCLVGAEGET